MAKGAPPKRLSPGQRGRGAVTRTGIFLAESRTAPYACDQFASSVAFGNSGFPANLEESMGFWKGWILGFLAALVAAAAAVFCYFDFGFAPVATAAAPMPFERFLANHALHAVVARAAGKVSPVDPTEANLQSAATVYRENCAVCHGLPGEGKTRIAQGEFPKPPQLLQGKGVTDDPVGRTFWVVQNGIRLTGMPAFGKTLTETQLWQVAELLAHAQDLPASVKDHLTRLAPGPALITLQKPPRWTHAVFPSG